MSEVEQTVKILDRIFNARTVAVVGASADPTKFGFMALNSIVCGGYEGQIYPVNPKGGEILGLKVYSSLKELPHQPDLVVVIVPAGHVPEVLKEAGQKGIPGAAILSAGFREAGRTDLETEIQYVSKQYGIRLMGPNIQGINYLPNKLCAMFFPVITTRGPLAIISQSGTVTAALSEWAANEGFGISAAINLGNQVDLCESDYIEFFVRDENTKAIALYLEGLKDGDRFLNTIIRIANQKPIIVLKSGKSAVGQRSTRSHTGSLAGNNHVFNGACHQFGVIWADELEDLYDCGKALATMREPRGNRLLMISTSGGACTLAADEAEVRGLLVPELPGAFRDELIKLELSPMASFSNPLDLASISAEHFQKVALLADQYDFADIFLLNFGDPVVGATDVTKYLSANIKASLAVSFLGGGEEEKLGRVKMQEAGIPVFPTPERAIRGIAAAVLYAKNRRPRKRKSLLTGRKKQVTDESPKFILEPEAISYLIKYNIPYPDHGLAHNVEDVVKIANRIGYPVVLKVVSEDIIHKSDVGGVVAGLGNTTEVSTRYKEMLDRIGTQLPGVSVEGVLVCKEAPPGFETIVGALQDPVFGPTIMFGLGGIYAEVFRDVSFRIAPLERMDAEEMVHGIRGYPLLAGTRRQQGCDVEALIELLLSVSQMITEQSEIEELDFNPVRLFEKGLMVLDIRLIIKKPSQKCT